MASKSPAGHLIGAYGILWDRHEVTWQPGSGRNAWQMIGYRSCNKPALTMCDFRRASGFYVLFDDFRAVYAGLARSDGGLGARLRWHHENDTRNWSRFCWFALDDVHPAPKRWTGWTTVKPRQGVDASSSETVIKESEALLIAVLGLQDQNQMRFLQGQRWKQLTEADFIKGGVARKVKSTTFSDPYWLQLLDGKDE